MMKTAVSTIPAFVLALLPASSAPAATDEAQSVYDSTVIKEGAMRMIAHRGYSAVAPENTLPAYIAAGKSEFWGAECDIHRTKDGVWVLMHDDTVDRTTDGSGEVSDMTYAEISALTIDDGNNIEQYPDTKVPTLEEYLDACKEDALHPVIEIKEHADPATMPELAALLAAREERDMFYIISFGRKICTTIKQALPWIPVYLLVDEKGLQENIDFAAANWLDGMDIHVYGPDDYPAKVRAAGLDAFVWTVDGMGDAERLYKLGVTALTSNCLTQEKPNLNAWQKFVWAIKNFFAKFSRQ